ncbi:MAG: hypothetical protein E6K54_06485 [Gammaproteobacteria bacterium]|nr:MAG: hypothetical protein E6K54_06485 [Gammaproteobacteria bacterium]
MTMWPSNTEVRNTLSQTGVLLFRDGNLQLNSKLDLAKTLLEKELLISTIDTINATFDQNDSNIEKIEQLHKAKSAFPALRNGRLSHLLKACTQDIAITSHLKIQSQI